MGLRCFVAVDVPAEVREELSGVQTQLESVFESAEARVKFVEKHNLHLTLKFLGEQSDVGVRRVKENLKKVKFSKFDSRLGRLGVFPSPSYIRVVWASLEPSDKFKELNKMLDEALGSKSDKFESHVTLARIRNVKDKVKLVKGLESLKVKPLCFLVEKFVLKKSTILSTGPVYEDIGMFEFS